MASIEDIPQVQNEQEQKVGKVVHCKKSEYDVFIGRPSKWGNPFKIGEDGSREQVIKLYENYIKSNKKLVKDLPELKGKILGCWCKPLPCHGDVLLQLANSNYKFTKKKKGTPDPTTFTRKTQNFIR